MQIASLSAQSRRRAAAPTALRQALLGVELELSTEALGTELRQELETGSLARSFRLVPTTSPRERFEPAVRVVASDAADSALQVIAAVGNSEAARYAVFELVQALVARSRDVRVQFVAKPRAGAASRFPRAVATEESSSCT